jgi:hypothetical protein
VVIGAGLKGGETVVVAGVHKLVAGQQVRPVQDNERTALPAAPALAQAESTVTR